MSLSENLLTPSLSRREFLKLGALSLLNLALPQRTKEAGPNSWVKYFSRGDPDSNKVAITMDDGWSDDNVEAAMKKLSSFDIPATFFPVGTVMKRNPLLWQEAIDAGFELHNHTMQHLPLDDKNVNIAWQISQWEKVYASLERGEYTNKVVRAPQNRGVNDPKLYRVASVLGYKGVAGWTKDSPGYRSTATTEEVIDTMEPYVSGGSILLFHFLPTDLSALEPIVEIGHRRELEFVRLSQLPGVPIYQDTVTRPTDKIPPRRAGGY